MIFRVGLTGGIGCGKSSVCRLFADMAVPIVDADVVARQLVEPGQPALGRIVDTFGSDILNPDGSLHRAALRQLIFTDIKHKQALEAILHPMIYDEMEAQVAALSAAYCILAIPLLLEAKKKYAVDRMLVVDCSEELQCLRVMARDKVEKAQVKAIIAAQAGRAERLAAADDIIDNSGPTTSLAEQVKNLHNSYILFATARTSSA